MDGLDDLTLRFPDTIDALLRQVVDWLASERPDLSPKVRPGWGSVNYHHRRAGFVLALFPYADRVSMIFQQGRLLSSPLLEGETRQVRWVVLRPGEPVPWEALGVLILEAIALRA